jgi:hypothetical protein
VISPDSISTSTFQNTSFPSCHPAIYLTTRPDLGGVSKGKLVTIDNFYDLFNGVLNPKQIEGLRLLLTPFPQQQFNQTDDRRSVKANRGVACFDWHANGGRQRCIPSGGRYSTPGIPASNRDAQVAWR